MPLTLTNTFKTEKNKQENAPVALYTVHDYDGAGSNLYFAEYDTDVVYNSVTYLRFPITHEFIGENNQGEIEQVKVRISNISRLIQAYLENYDWRNKKVTIKLVWANQLSDPDAYIDFTYYIDNYSAGQDVAEFTLSPKLDVLTVTLPSRTFSRNYCLWVFKSAECGYAGAEVSCDKTKQRCKVLLNYLRFGGFPSIPSYRIYV